MLLETSNLKREDQTTTEFLQHLSRHGRAIYAFILSVVPNWADADEILQETTTRLWQEYEKFEPGSDFVAWGCRVAHFQIFTFRKKSGRERVHFDQQFIDNIANEIHASSDDSDHRRDGLADCMEKLSEPNRKLLNLIYHGGYSIKSVADQLGKSVPAVYKILSRVRMSLHRCIDQFMVEETS